jgi:hypothetical protein
MASYTYDAKGHVLTKEQSAAQSLFDLKYTYDVAERLRTVSGRNPSNPNEFRLMKEFTYATTNAGLSPVDRRAGKLIAAARYNYPTLAAKPIDQYLVRVTESYEYKDDAGRRTDRTTAIERTPNEFGDPVWVMVREIEQAVTYDPLSARVTMTYPMCTGCAHSPQIPSRNLTATYDAGRVVGLSDYVNTVTYHPNGLRNQIHHTNLMVDTQSIDATTKMARPSSLESKFFDGCTAPSIVSTSPAGMVAADGTFELWVNVNSAGTTPFSYQWFDAATDTPVGSVVTNSTTYNSLTVTPSQTTTYYVKIFNRCRTVTSTSIRVGEGTCVAPWINTATSTKNGASYTLTADARGTGTLTYAWRRDTDQAAMGNGAAISVSPTVSTSYTVTVTHACSSAVASRSVYVGIGLPAPTGVTASKLGNTIRVTWSAVPTATDYVIQKYVPGQGWSVSIADPDHVSPYDDVQVQAGTTYAYRVIAKVVPSGGSPLDSNHPASPTSAADMATMLSFSPVVTGGKVSFNHFNEILVAVNAARVTAGWSPLTWSTILSPQDPLANVGGPVMGRHLAALRMRMNEAVQALGVTVGTYTDPDPQVAQIKAIHLTELQARTQ